MTKPAICRVIPTGSAYQGRQGLTYLTGLTGATAQSRAICMSVLTLPPGARAKTHLHQGIETAVYVLDGDVEMFHGAKLEEHLKAGAGDFVYVPADVPHRVMNRSERACRALVAHSASDDQAGIVMLPDLDAMHA
jgi:uncharacterized RmlC-like cupin family protein